MLSDFPGLGLWMPWDASYGHGKSLEMTFTVLNEYMKAFTFISVQFWVAQEIKKFGV